MSIDHAAAREAMKDIVLFGHAVGGVDKPVEGEAEPTAVAELRPQRPTGSADQGMRGPALPSSPRQDFIDGLRRIL